MRLFIRAYVPSVSFERQGTNWFVWARSLGGEHDAGHSRSRDDRCAVRQRPSGAHRGARDSSLVNSACPCRTNGRLDHRTHGAAKSPTSSSKAVWARLTVATTVPMRPRRLSTIIARTKRIGPSCQSPGRIIPRPCPGAGLSLTAHHVRRVGMPYDDISCATNVSV